MAIKAGVPGLEFCKVYDLNRETAERFADRMEGRAGMAIETVSSPGEAIRDSDVISTATTASASYVRGEWYKPGAFHAEISFWDTPPEALRFAGRIFVDDWRQVRHHGVDVSWRAVRDGIIGEECIAGNLGEVVAGIKTGRGRADERIFFNPIGLAVHDLSEAFRVYQGAAAAGIGVRLPLFRQSDGWLDTISLGGGV
jgi:ornithine cyclodeaminase